MKAEIEQVENDNLESPDMKMEDFEQILKLRVNENQVKAEAKVVKDDEDSEVTPP